jgi:hypothetical protein
VTHSPIDAIARVDIGSPNHPDQVVSAAIRCAQESALDDGIKFAHQTYLREIPASSASNRRHLTKGFIQFTENNMD